MVDFLLMVKATSKFAWKPPKLRAFAEIRKYAAVP